MLDGQVDPFNEGGVQPSRQGQSLQGVLESGLCPQTHHVYDARQLAPPVAFFHLAVDQARSHLPSAYVAPSTSLFAPCPKMSRESIEVEIEPVTRKEWETERRPGSAAERG
jgi:hypothetical protein